MSSSVNPYQVIVVGENSFIRLSTDGGATICARCSHWRVFWTPAGAGQALFIASSETEPPRVYGDNEPMVRYLQAEIESLLYKPFSDTKLPVQKAEFRRHGCPPEPCEEYVEFDGGTIRLTWSDFMAAFNYSTNPGDGGRPIGLQTTFFPARIAGWTDCGLGSFGIPWSAPRDGQPSTSACLAWAETWVGPK